MVDSKTDQNFDPLSYQFDLKILDRAWKKSFTAIDLIKFYINSKFSLLI